MKYCYTFLFAIFFLSLTAQVQPTYPVKKAEGRPTIGLCLSGGGAKGFAHIGVLKLIDSLGIPIDYVAGTSMGSIVGGLYAIGYTGEQIETVVNTSDWGDLMDPIPQRKYENFSTKDYAKRNLFTVGLKDFKVVLPAGLNNASKVTQKLHNATIGYHGYQNFLEFPRGFLCIGANLNTGEEVIFTEGSLPDAMRASMAIPSIFTPHHVDGKTIVDGGTLNNFPTDKLKALGCDIIIGIDLASEIPDTAAVSMTEVLERTAMFINKKTSKERQELCDILIQPDLKGLTGSDFGKGPQIIETGTKAGHKHLPELVALANQLKKYPPANQQLPYYKPDSISVERIDVNGLKRVSKAYVIGAVNIDDDYPAAISNLEESMQALYGSSYFDQVNYNLFKQENGKYVVSINVVEKPNDLDIGLGVRHDPDFQTSFLINLAARNAFIKGSRFNLDIAISERPRFGLLYEVDRGFKPGFGIRSNLYFTKPTLYQNRQSLGSYNYDDWTIGLYAMSSLHNLGVFRLGGEFNYSFLNVKDVPSYRDALDPDGENKENTLFKLDHLNLFAEISVDVLDDKDFPTKGHYGYVVGRYHTSVEKNTIIETIESQFITLYGHYNMAFSPTRWLTFMPEFVSGWSLIDYSIHTYSFLTGGLGKNYFNYQTTFLGYRYTELYNLSNVTKGGLEMRVNHFRSHYLSAMINYGFTIDVFNIGPPGPPEPTKPVETDLGNYYDFSGFGIKYSIQTFLGPVELTAHKNLDGGLWLFYFNFGYWF